MPSVAMKAMKMARELADRTTSSSHGLEEEMLTLAELRHDPPHLRAERKRYPRVNS